MVNRKPSLLFLVSISLVTIIVICMFNPGTFSLSLSLMALRAAIALMLLYLLFNWRRIMVKDRLSILLSIIAWAGLLYGLKW